MLPDSENAAFLDQYVVSQRSVLPGFVKVAKQDHWMSVKTVPTASKRRAKQHAVPSHSMQFAALVLAQSNRGAAQTPRALHRYLHAHSTVRPGWINRCQVGLQVSGASIHPTGGEQGRKHRCAHVLQMVRQQTSVR